MSKRRRSAYLSMLAVSAIWGAAGPVIKFTLGSIPPFIFLLYRFGVSALFALVYIALRRPKLPSSAQFMTRILPYSFILTTLTLGLLFLGFDRTSSLVGTFITSFVPVIVATEGVIFLHEHYTRQERIGTAIAVVGILLVVLEPVFQGNPLNGESVTLIGNLLVLLAALSDASSSILAKVLLRKKHEPFLLTNLSFIGGFITTLPITLYLYTPSDIVSSIVSADIPAHMGVLYMALISGTLGYYFWHRGQKTIEVGDAAIFGYLKPVWAAPLALLWLGESITIPFIIGAIIIGIGVWVAEHKKKRKR